MIDAALDLPMREKNASPEKDGTECTNKPAKNQTLFSDAIAVATARIERLTRAISGFVWAIGQSVKPH